MSKERILVTGATGYIGKRLIPRLLEKGYIVRAMARKKGNLMRFAWASHPNLEIVEGDILNPSSLEAPLSSCNTAYYLVHSMTGKKKGFEHADRDGVKNFISTAEKQSLKRCIYLSGLGREEEGLSRHLQSRREVANLLHQSSLSTTVLQAAMIIGSGSASFEILRYLVEHVPIMVTPKWVRTKCQPIAIENVLSYLVGVLDVPETENMTFDIGGPTVTTYRELMNLYADLVNLPHRVMIPVNVLSPKLSSYWIGLVTPLPPSLGRPLVEGLRNEVICTENKIRELIPQKLLSYREAIEQALAEQNSWEPLETAASAHPLDPKWAGGDRFYLEKTREHKAQPGIELTKQDNCLVRIEDDGTTRRINLRLIPHGLWQLLTAPIALQKARRKLSQ